MNIPQHSACGSSHREGFSFKAATALVLGSFLILYIWASTDFGMGWDETRRWQSGDAKLAYYTEVWSYVKGDREAFPSVGVDRYPGLFDMSLALLDRVVPGERLVLAHAYSALWGWLAVVGVAVIGRALAGWRLAFFCALFLGLAPIFVGHAGHNPKDIPFATTYVWGIVAVLWFYRALPRPPARVWLGCGVLFGLSMAVRISGGVFFVYVLGSILLWLLCHRDAWTWSSWGRWMRPWILGVAVCGGIAFVVLLPFWPAMHQAPLRATVGTLGQLHDLHTVASTKYVHFRGEIFEAGRAPWYYAPWMLLIKVPEIWILGWLTGSALALAGAWRHRDGLCDWLAERGQWLVLALAAVFPLLYVMVVQPQIHNGVRHLLFMLPPLAAVAAAGIDRFLTRLEIGGHSNAGECAEDQTAAPSPSGPACAPRKRSHVILFSVFLVGVCLVQIERNWRLHPYQYLYFNSLAGGPVGAFGEYELDYWCLANREALERRDEWAPAIAGHRYRISMSGLSDVNRRFLPEDMVIVPFGEPADFFVATTTMLTHQLVPGEPVFVIERAGLPILVVKDLREAE